MSLTTSPTIEGDRADEIDGRLIGPDASGTLSRSRPSGRRTLLLSWLVLAVPLVIVLVGAWSYRWVQEDAFIDFRVIDNLLAGHGPVYNVGERVEVYSDPLWVFLLAGVHELVPFLSLEWLSVLLGLGGTGTGVVLGGRAMQRLGSRGTDRLIVPLGLLIFSVVAGVWEFATSGLEMGMAFGWIGLSFWLLVRTEQRRRSALGCAFVMGLGPLIRPELLLVSAIFLAGLACVVASSGWRGPTGIARRWAIPLLAALLLPVVYELWRMAYFAMFVSNSELAKSGGGSDLPQGLAYLSNFLSTYALWVPMLLALPVVLPRLRGWWRGGDRAGSVVLATPLLAGLADAMYVVHLGGDYMDARLLLPAFLCCCLTVFVDIGQFRTLMVLPLIGLVVWSGICVGALRPSNDTAWVNNMHDERANWVHDTGQAHPIDVSDYLRLVSLGPSLEADSASKSPGHKYMLVLENPVATFISPSLVDSRSTTTLARQWHRFIEANLSSAHTNLPFRLAVNLASIGALGYLIGPNVYIYDTLSLANPIGSHTTVAVRGIPGHEKVIGPEWMVGRFGVPGETYPGLKIFGLVSETAAARRALNCDPLKSYLAAITKPLTVSQAWSNVIHSVTYTRMSFSPDANDAARQLCGN